ncbi:helitron helicase-like domain-containing protein [Artemisia annua]|uniref:Helitron helicase-like domain-containing protein n=1 Tax=Artemisia annua TaxID=35608 RepID=A0A2U1PR51_ARTAN|nr:helitron helicase-like domain-containing protein [Artemisia annua]
MKTKQKAIRRIPTVSCPAPLDLSSDVEDMDYQLQSLKRDRSLSDVMGLDTCTENTTKRICTEKSGLLHHSKIAFVGQNSLQQHHTADSVHLTLYLQKLMAEAMSEFRKQIDDQIRTRPVLSISETPQRRSKRPRFIQVRQQDLRTTNNTVRAHTTQRRCMRQGAQVDDSINKGRGPYVFKVLGQIYHWIGSICLELNKEPKFLQLYIYDTANEVRNRLQHFNKSGSRLRQDIVQNLIQVLDKHNELVKFFRTARDKIERADIPDFKIKLFGVVGSKQYDLPAGDCIGAIVFEGGPNVETNYDVIIEPRGGQPQRIDKLNSHYMSLHFPLLFIHGDEGYHLDFGGVLAVFCCITRKTKQYLIYVGIQSVGADISESVCGATFNSRPLMGSTFSAPITPVKPLHLILNVVWDWLYRLFEIACQGHC